MAVVRQDEQTSPAPHPGQIFMPATSRASAEPPTASAGAAPTPSPIPPPPNTSDAGRSSSTGEEEAAGGGGTAAAAPSSSGASSFPTPKIRLEVRDVTHAGARRFLSLVDASALLPRAVVKVQNILYNSPNDRTTHMPPTRSVTVILRDMDGVAYTTGSDLDSDHKEIHFSLSYIAHVNAGDGKDDGGGGEGRVAHEIDGVLTHELVHCYQWDAKGTCPGGLIEGIADFVRLHCGLSPPHWRKELDGRWDRGYQHTAYFLDYLERRYGDGTVRRINEKLRTTEYREEAFWTELLGRPVEQLYDDYVKMSKQDAEKNGC